MFKMLVPLVFSLLFCPLSPLKACIKHDRIAVENLLRNSQAGWNRGSGEEFASIYEQSRSRFENIFGMKFSGRAEIAKRHQEIFETFLKDTSIELFPEKIEMIPIEDNSYYVVNPWQLHFKSGICATKGDDEVSPQCPKKGTFYHIVRKNKDQKLEIIFTRNALNLRPGKS